MKEAQPGLRAALDGVKPGIALEGESTLPLARTCDHHLSWAQWFSDSAVPGVLRARWFEQRHMLHHTRRWNRDHTEELHSAWLNGVGILVWENVFGAWVGWSERDKALLRAMRPVQRKYADLLATGEWTPLAAASPDARVVASRWSDGETTLWTVANRGDAYAGPVGELEVELPALGIAAFVGTEQVMVAGGGDATLPGARGRARARAGRSRRGRAGRVRRRRAAAADRGLPAARDRHLRRGAVRRGVEAAAAAPARLRRGRAPGAARAVRDRRARGGRRPPVRR